MTNKEAISVIENRLELPDYGDSYGSVCETDYIQEAIDTAIAALKYEPKWISVKDRLPEAKGKYLVAYHPCYWDDVKPQMETGIDSYRGGDSKRCWARNKYQSVTHWMPLPEPPKE